MLNSTSPRLPLLWLWPRIYYIATQYLSSGIAEVHPSGGDNYFTRDGHAGEFKRKPRRRSLFMMPTWEWRTLDEHGYDNLF
jgi:hypothetical protein